MQPKQQKSINENREIEILEELSKLSEWEIRSFALDESSLATVNAVLQYKRSKANEHNEIGAVEILSQHKIK